MKLINIITAIAAATLLLAACVPSTAQRQGVTQVAGYDFREYADAGFLFTPEKPSGNYESLGIVTASVTPEIVKGQYSATTKDLLQKYNVVEVQGQPWFIEKLNSADAVREMYKIATEFGGDAVTNFTVRTIPARAGVLEYTVFEVSGFVIKRK